MLKSETIINYISENEGIIISGVVEKFSKEHKIKKESVKNHIYRLKKKGFLKENQKKLFSTNPFDNIFKEIMEAENSYQLYKNMAQLIDGILIMLKDIAPDVENRIKGYMMDSLNKCYRFTSYRSIEK